MSDKLPTVLEIELLLFQGSGKATLKQAIYSLNGMILTYSLISWSYATNYPR